MHSAQKLCVGQRCLMLTWPSGKLQFEFQKIAKNLTFVSQKLSFLLKKMTILSIFLKDMSRFWQFFDIQIAIFRRVRCLHIFDNFFIYFSDPAVASNHAVCRRCYRSPAWMSPWHHRNTASRPSGGKISVLQMGNFTLQLS